MKVVEVVAGILCAAIRPPGLAFITLVRIRRHRRQVHAFPESRATAQANLIDNRVVRQSDCDATVISYSGGVCLVAGDVAAVSTVAGNEKMLTSGNNSAVVDGHTRSDGAATA